MALYHVRLKVFSRSRGESATAAAAYRGAFCIEDRRTGEAHDYTKRRGVERVDFFAPIDAPAWASDPTALFNAAEAAETRTNACVAREAVVALPSELSAAARASLVREISGWLVDRYGLAIMVATHAPDAQGDQRNHHAHLLMTVRRIGADGLGAKVRVLDDRATGKNEVRALRAAVAEITNRHLAAAGAVDRVDHRTLAAQADEAAERGDLAAVILLTRQPTVHRGRALTAMRRRGAETGPDLNGAIGAENQIMFFDFLRRAERIAPMPSRPAPARRPGGSPVSPSLRPGRAQGPGARTLAVQARATRRQQRDQERAHARYLAMLEGVRLELAEEGRRTLVAYAQARALSAADFLALVDHVRRDRGCLIAVEQANAARRAADRAGTRVANQRETYVQAQVQTAKALADAERGAEETAPSRLRLLSCRQWAEKRRAEREAVALAERVERRAGGRDLRAARATLSTAEKEAAQAEAERCARFPLPGDRQAAIEEITATKSDKAPTWRTMPQWNPKPEVRRRPRP